MTPVTLLTRKSRIQGQSYDMHLYKQKIIKTYGYTDEPLFKKKTKQKQKTGKQMFLVMVAIVKVCERSVKLIKQTIFHCFRA